jgi:hypothetical protein
MILTDTLESLQAKAASQGTTVSELLRYALGLAEYIESVQRQKARVLVEWPDGERSEILPRIPWGISRSERPAAARQTQDVSATPLAEVKPGEVSDNVKIVQKGLIRQAESDPDLFFPGNTDGVNGPRTQEAIRRYQERNGLAADGVVGEVTWTTPAQSSGESLAEAAGLAR